MTRKGAWSDDREVQVLDALCPYRSCLHVGENKGTYVQGRGYVSYHRRPWLECVKRNRDGCPAPIPAPEPEESRCCRVPDFAKPREGTLRQRCRTCGAWAAGWVLDARRGLPTLEHVSCKHADVVCAREDLFERDIWRCRACGLLWDHEPGPREPGETFGEMLDRRFRPA